MRVEVVGLVEQPVIFGKVSEGNPRVDMVGHVKADVVGHHVETCEPMLVHRMRGVTAIVVLAHAAVFSN